MAGGVSGLVLMRRSLTRAEWMRLAALGGIVLGLHLVGFGVLFLVVAPRHSAVLGVGVGLTAWGFGLRHAFDADHISAIDNTTRKLMADGKRPLAVGFFFSLGHSTIVFALSLGLAFFAKALAGQVSSDGSQLHNLGGYIGTSVSGTFLYLIAAINLVILVGIVRIFRDMRRGEYDEETLEQRLNERGLINRVLGPLARSVRHSWQMYPIGVLFGLGFDTATEVGLLALAASAGGANLPWYAILCLPVIFAAGMSMMDTADGAFMSVAYGWAFSNPVRKVFYNLAITGLSVAVALVVGSVELLSLVVQYFGFSGGFWDFVAGLDLNTVGFVIVGMFIVTWAVAVSLWFFGSIEVRWTLQPQTHDTTGPAKPWSFVAAQTWLCASASVLVVGVLTLAIRGALSDDGPTVAAVCAGSVVAAVLLVWPAVRMDGDRRVTAWSAAVAAQLAFVAAGFVLVLGAGRSAGGVLAVVGAAGVALLLAPRSLSHLRLSSTRDALTQHLAEGEQVA